MKKQLNQMQKDINILKGKKTPVKSKYKYYGDKIVVSLGLISLKRSRGILWVYYRTA